MSTANKCDFTPCLYYSILASHRKEKRMKWEIAYTHQSGATSSCRTYHFVKKIKQKCDLICSLRLLPLAAERWRSTEGNRDGSFLQAHKRAVKSLVCITNLLPPFPPADRNCGLSPRPAEAHLPQMACPIPVLPDEQRCVSCPGGTYQRVLLRQLCTVHAENIILSRTVRDTTLAGL